jgi:hypothetical protein
MQGLIREARDLQGIRKDVAPKAPLAGPPENPPEGGGGSPRKKS